MRKPWLGAAEDKVQVRAELVNDLATAIRKCLGDTESEQIVLNSKIQSILQDLWLFETEIDDWHGIDDLPRVIQNMLTAARELPELMTNRGYSNHLLWLAGKLIGELENAASLTPNEKNWPTIKRWISSAAGRASMIDFSLGYKPDKEYHDSLVSRAAAIPSELDGHIASLQAGEPRLMDMQDLATELRKMAFMPLIPQHPQFAVLMKEISLDFRRIFLRLGKKNLKNDEAIVALRDVRSRLWDLITKYGPVTSEPAPKVKSLEPTGPVTGQSKSEGEQKRDAF